MKLFLLLVFIPSLITADILCPNSKTTCPEDKQCCEVYGEYSCCDSDEDQGSPARRLRVFAEAELKRFKSPTKFDNKTLSANGTILHYGSCNVLSCKGTCCSNSWDGCCEYYGASCCSGNTCCRSASKCCTNGCCEYMDNCCENGCCEYGYSCCKAWCCKNGYKCGSKFMSCRGVSVSPEIVAFLFLAASVFVFYRL